MIITRNLFSKYVKGFDFVGLFNYLGWDRSRAKLSDIMVKNQTYHFTNIAQKSSFLIVECRGNDGKIPVYSIRSRIDQRIKKASSRAHDYFLRRNK